jgi:hypothetical protein
LTMAFCAAVVWSFGAARGSIFLPLVLLVMILGSVAVSLLQLRKM